MNRSQIFRSCYILCICMLSGCCGLPLGRESAAIAQDSTSVAWLSEYSDNSVQEVCLDVVVTATQVLQVSLQNQGPYRDVGSESVPYMLEGDVVFDDLIFRESWNSDQPLGLTVVFISQDRRVYGCIPERGYTYGWTPAFKDSNSNASGSHVRLLKYAELLKRNFEILPLIKAFLEAFPECRGMKGQFMGTLKIGSFKNR
jgi:hypothetical protein